MTPSEIWAKAGADSNKAEANRTDTLIDTIPSTSDRKAAPSGERMLANMEMAGNSRRADA
jgi:hypothetical protein